MHFARALKHVLEMEGGFSDLKLDRGGATKFGITKATLSAYRGRSVTSKDVAGLSLDEARAIYHTRYWAAAGLEQLTSEAVACVVFDQAVNRGPKTAVRALQRVLESTFAADLALDGVLGPATAHAANHAPERQLTIRLIIEAQKNYLDIWKQNPTQSVFLRGWMERTWRLFESYA